LEETVARSLIACPREVGAQCPFCAHEIALGDPIMVCRACGSVHHRTCWRDHDRCGSYTCAPSRRPEQEPVPAETVLTITQAEIDRAVPLPPGIRPLFVPAKGVATRSDQPPGEARFSRLAIASFVCALAGIPLFGVITGLVAILLAVIALGAIRTTQVRGMGLALSGLLLGIADVAGWMIFLSVMLTRPGPDLRFTEMPPDLSVIQELDPPLQRAMRANVLLERGLGLAGLGSKMIGSGVILQIDAGEALIVTNRHVVDDDFASSSDNASDNGQLSRLGNLSVRMIGQPEGAGRVVWLAPGQIDLALVRAKCPSAGQAMDASWQKGRPMKVGETVFAIGNPHRLGWTHTQGVISQLRTQEFDTHQIRVIQTQAAINPGNSGGGLYDREGYLLGINTWTADKRVSEGIGFAITLDTLLDLAPRELKAPRQDKEPRAEAKKSGSRR
jgi:S1-C subfamily serine protease